MKSAFYKVAPELRYSLVWEDAHLLYAALQVQPTDKVLVITAAGCNVLNTLLASPASVTAIDLNGVQNEMLRLKAHVISHHDYDVFANLLGLNGPDVVPAAWAKVQSGLSEGERNTWEPLLAKSPAGLLTGGKLETYIRAFLFTLPAEVQAHLHELILFENVAEQRAYFGEHLDKAPFRDPFIDYFDKVNLSRGRHPALFTYTPESGGELFYERLKAQIGDVPVKENFFFRFFFFGLPGIPQKLLPPAYQKANYQKLRSALPRLQIVIGEAMDYLLSEAGQEITKASMSNIFEYTTVDEFRSVCRQLSPRAMPLRFIFWNLLQEQGTHLKEDGWQDIPLSENVNTTACFYFQNFRAVQNK